MALSSSLRSFRLNSSFSGGYGALSPFKYGSVSQSVSPLTLCRQSSVISSPQRCQHRSGMMRCWQRWNTTNGGKGIGGKSGGPQSSSASPSSSNSNSGTFLQRFLAPKPMPEKNTPRWYAEMALICTVFGITGSSTMFMVRPAVSNVLGLEGSMKDGPWSYRICSLVIMTPMYSILLVIVGTLFGRHAYFRHFSVKMFSRFGVPPELLDKNFHAHAKNFKKW